MQLIRTRTPISTLAVALAAVVSQAAAPLRAQPPAHLPARLTQQAAASTQPCASPGYREFDFWVGNWDIAWPASVTTQNQPGRGTNRIESSFNGCVIVEHFNAPGMPLVGMSVSVFNPVTRKWSQTWVDDSGSYITGLTGEFKDGQMVLSREVTAPSGQKVIQRVIWKNIRRESIDWTWERSSDGGQTWQLLWSIRYQRKS